MSANFKFPEIYNFPPFWTLQPAMESRRRQCEIWCDIILQWTKANDLKQVVVADLQKTPLFKNQSIQRELNGQDAIFILDQLVQRQNAEWADDSQSKLKMIWRKPAQWGTLMHQWAQKNNSIGVMFTFFELREGEDTQSEPFHMLDQEQFMEAASYLASKKMAKLIKSDNFDESGISFL